MTKELTPLETSKQLKDFVSEFVKNGLDRMFVNGSFDIIETALKRLEELDSLFTLTNHNGKFYVVIDKTEFNQISKKLKALEIIKEKGCSYIEKALIVSCKNYEEYCIEMNSNRVYSSKYECEKAFKTQEEFDLLKELL